MLDLITGPFLRTRGRFKSLYETIQEQYLSLIDFYEEQGHSLNLYRVCIRALKVATVFTCLVIFVVVPIIFYYRGFEDPYVYLEMAKDMSFTWLSALILMLVSFFMWTATSIVGKTFAESEFFLGFIGKRWGKRINEIAEAFLSENDICKFATLTSEGYEGKIDTITDKRESSTNDENQEDLTEFFTNNGCIKLGVHKTEQKNVMIDNASKMVESGD